MPSAWMDVKAEVIAQYRQQKHMADAAIGRVDDAVLFAHLHAGDGAHTNSIAVLIKHLSGNFMSRWTDFLTSDGEKPDRERPREFLDEAGESRERLMARWEEGWGRLFAALDALSEDDFSRTVFIRGEAHTVVQAILRNLLHTAHHVGQIDLMATALQP